MEQYIKKDGKIYKQTIIEDEVDIVQEEYKLQAWKDALVNDSRELAEYQAKIADIDALSIPDDMKATLKSSVMLYSPSSITQKMVDDQQAKVDALNNV